MPALRVRTRQAVEQMTACDLGKGEQQPADGYSIKRRLPDSLSEAELATVFELLRRGSAVDPKSAAKEIPLASSVVLAMKNTEIVGVGAIKRPRPWYAAVVQTKSNVSFDQYTSELGYVAVDAEHRRHHLSRRIVAVLLAEFRDDLFATTDDDRMKRTLLRFEFVERGEKWKGERGSLSLWTRCATTPAAQED